VKQFWQRWLINTLAVMVAANVVSGIRYDTFSGLLTASLLLGVFNAFLRPLLILVSLPLLVLTLGLFTLFINALLVYLLGVFVKSFHVDSFGAAFWGGLIISFISWFASRFFGLDQNSPPSPTAKPPSPSPPLPGNGPIIDV
jgi:putative membrane protein